MRAYQDGLAEFEEIGAQVVAVSVASVEVNRKFSEKAGLAFPILSDAARQVSKLYGVLTVFRLARRVTFIIDAQGVICHVDEGRPALDPANALRALRVI